eukprot:488169-Amphidinium_carterae.1
MIAVGRYVVQVLRGKTVCKTSKGAVRVDVSFYVSDTLHTRASLTMLDSLLNTMNLFSVDSPLNAVNFSACLLLGSTCFVAVVCGLRAVRGPALSSAGGLFRPALGLVAE